MRILQSYRTIILLMSATSLLALLIILASGPQYRFALDPLMAVVGAIIIGFVCARLSLGVPSRAARHVWFIVLAILVLVSIAQFLPALIQRSNAMENLEDAVLLAAAPLFLWATARFDPVPLAVRKVLWLAFCSQLAGIGLDLAASRSEALPPSLNVSLADDVVDLLSMQLYLLATALYVSWLRAQIFRRNRKASQIGDFSRHLFLSQRLLRRYRYPRIGTFVVPGGRIALGFARFFKWYFPMSPQVRREFGRGYLQQLLDICAVAFRHGLDPQAYYMFELYRSAHRARAAAYLTRYETKNGMLKLLTTQLPKGDHRTNLGDKLAVIEMCERNGIPCTRNLIVAERGDVQLRCSMTELQQDLFMKPRMFKGARGAQPIEYHDGIYCTKDGARLNLAGLLDLIAERSLAADMLVQTRIGNHPGLAGLADRSLIAVRVFTCLDQADNPVVTHGMLRVLSKLEPEWPTSLELGSRVDLATGTLEIMTGDKAEMALRWYDRHPVTNALVVGRQVPCWRDMCDVAVAAHRACSDRLIVGWDIAIGPEGPVIVEGNGYPDVDFLQRVQREGIGDSPLGPLLMPRLLDLEHRIETGTLVRRKKIEATAT